MDVRVNDLLLTIKISRQSYVPKQIWVESQANRAIKCNQNKNEGQEQKNNEQRNHHSEVHTGMAEEKGVNKLG